MGKITKGLFWKVLERFGVQGVQFVLQIIMARILSPDHYGTLALMIIFTSLANVFIQNGFSSSLIQNKDVTEEDYSSVFWASLGITIVLYALIFFAAPFIAVFYEMPDIVTPFRVLALSLFPGVLYSIQHAKVSREMDFKKVFLSSVIGIAIAGTAGVVVALLGGGLWALVVQNMLNVVVSCFVMLVAVKWRPKLVCNLRRVAILFSYGWKLMVANLLDTLEDNMHSLVIGKKYDSDTLGYYNRGDQFPQFLTNAVNGAMSSVLFSAMSASQDKKAEVKSLARSAMMVSTYMILPMMAGLACVGTPLIQLLLTEKWLPAVPYMQINCFCYAFYTIDICNLQVVTAMGRSDIFLKQEIVKKIYGIALLVAAVLFFDSPMAIAVTDLISTAIGWCVNAYPNKKLMNYSFLEQFKDLLPSIAVTALMGIVVLLIGTLNLSPLLLLTIQIPAGVVIYIVLSWMFRLEPFFILLEKGQEILANR